MMQNLGAEPKTMMACPLYCLQRVLDMRFVLPHPHSQSSQRQEPTTRYQAIYPPT